MMVFSCYNELVKKIFKFDPLSKLGKNYRRRYIKEKHYRLMKNELTNTIEKKVFCFIMDLPESNSNKKTESKMKNHPIDDQYSF